jgi:hypothetical protein
MVELIAVRLSGTLRARACARYGVLVVGEESYRDFRQKYARATSHKLKPSGASRQNVTVYQSLHFLSNR